VSLFGKIKLFCPGCGREILYEGNTVSGVRHHKNFGIVCSKECWDKVDMKYVRMVLGKEDLT
jgi:hypothetical protein